MQKQKTGLFIGRFQPGLHLGQIDGIRQAMEKGVHDFLIGIGSSNKEFTKDNPFTYEERKHMVELSLKACLSGRQDFPGIRYQIFPLPDFPTDEERKNYILQTLPHFDCVVTGNPWVKEIFGEKGQQTSLPLRSLPPYQEGQIRNEEKEIIRLKLKLSVNGTFIRQQLALGKMDDIKKSLPSTVISYLKNIKAESRLKGLFGNV